MIRRANGGGLSYSLAATVDEAPRAIQAARERRLGLEIALFDTGAFLDSDSALRPVARLARAEPAVPLSVHGPIYDLNPGSPEPVVRDFSVRAMSAAVRAAKALGAERFVVHTGFNPLLPKNVERPWCAAAAEALGEVAAEARASGMRLLLENFFEVEPHTLVRLADAIGGGVGFCFDLAHARLRSSIPFGEWLSALGTRIAEFHLNDCDGKDDLHSALGDGVCEIVPFLGALSSGPLGALPIVLEMPLDRAAKSLAWLESKGFLARLA